MDLSDLKLQLCCPVCEDISPDPIIYQCVNGHNICRDCKDKVTICPMGRCEYHDPPTRNRTVEDLIVKSIVDFPCNNEGCGKEFKSIEVSWHKDNCPHRLIKCWNEGCGLEAKFQDMSKHRENCGHGLVWCDNGPDCSKRVKRMNLAEHMGKCDHSLVSCIFEANGCDRKGERLLMRAHILICDLQPVACKVKGCDETVLLQDRNLHESDCAHRIIPCPMYACEGRTKVCELSFHLNKKHKGAFLTKSPRSVLERELAIGNVGKFRTTFPILFSFSGTLFVACVEAHPMDDPGYFYFWVYVNKGFLSCARFRATVVVEGRDFSVRESGRVFSVDLKRRAAMKNCVRLHESVIERALVKEKQLDRGGVLRVKFIVEAQKEESAKA